MKPTRGGSGSNPRGEGTRAKLVAFGVLWSLLLAVEHAGHRLGGDALSTGSISGRAPLRARAAARNPAYANQQESFIDKPLHGGLESMLGVDQPIVLDEPPRTFDEYGFRNVRGALDRGPELVVAGNSFAMFGGRGTRLHELLEEATGLRSYNIGVTYSRRHDAASVYFEHEQLAPYFRAHPPRYLVWTVSENSLVPERFERYLDQTGTSVDERAWGSRLLGGVDALYERLFEYVAERKDRSLLNVRVRQVYHHSISPLLSAVPASFIRRPDPHAAPSAEAAGPARAVAGLMETILEVPLMDGSRMLFSGSSCRMMENLSAADAVEEVDDIVRSMVHIRELLQEHGVELIIVLIPTKSAVYHRFLDDFDRVGHREASSRRLNAVTERARSAGLHVVNLFHEFAERSEPGEPWLYYPTDIHWTLRGRKLAVEAVELLIRSAEESQGR